MGDGKEQGEGEGEEVVVGRWKDAPPPPGCPGNRTSHSQKVDSVPVRENMEECHARRQCVHVHLGCMLLCEHDHGVSCNAEGEVIQVVHDKEFRECEK